MAKYENFTNFTQKGWLKTKNWYPTGVCLTFEYPTRGCTSQVGYSNCISVSRFFLFGGSSCLEFCLIPKLVNPSMKCSFFLYIVYMYCCTCIYTYIANINMGHQIEAVERNSRQPNMDLYPAHQSWWYCWFTAAYEEANFRIITSRHII